jgi:D-inositol-3-phosphate glycosyltransferase
MIAIRIRAKATIGSARYPLRPWRNMKSGDSAATIWLIDPISHSGMAYSDVGQIDALRRLGALPVLVGSEGWMLPPAIVPRATAFRGTHGDRSRLAKGVAYLLSLLRLVRMVRARRPEIVHWQYSQLVFLELFAMAAIRMLGSRQVFTAHELLPWAARAHHRWLFARLYSVMDAVIVHNEDQRTELTRRFTTNPAKVHVAPLGDYALFTAPDRPQVEARARLGLDRDIAVALFFGAIRPSKGLEVLLGAWGEVAAASPGSMLLIVGKPLKGMEAERITSLIRDHRITDRVVTVFRQVDPDEANDYYRAADLVVLPYHEIGTSGVLRYAYNSARPVIATSVGEHVDRVIEGHTGYLVRPGDPMGLGRRLIEALRDRERLDVMGAAARDYAAAHLGWLEPARTMLEVYRSLRR